MPPSGGNEIADALIAARMELVQSIMATWQGDGPKLALQNMLDWQQRSQSGPERVVAIEDGTGQALSTRVNSDNNLGTESRYGRVSVVVDSEPVTSTSAQVVGARAGRLQLYLQNLDDTDSIHFRLGGGTATTSDPRLDPGQSFSLPPGIAFEGAVSAIATGAGSITLSIMEYTL